MKSYKTLVFVALLGVMAAGCQKPEELKPTDKPQDISYTLSVTAVKNVETKALSLVNNPEQGSKGINFYWVVGETVSVFNGGTVIGTLEVTEVTSPTTATLSGTIDNVEGISEEKSSPTTLMLLFPGRNEDGKWTYTGQDGSEPSEDGSLATMYDYASASIEIWLNGETIEKETNAVSFTNEQSIFRFGFGSTAINSFNLSSAEGQIITARNFVDNNWVSTSGALSVNAEGNTTPEYFYVAVRNENESTADTFFFNAYGNDNALYLGEKSIPAKGLGYGKYLTATVKLIKQTFEHETSGEIAEFTDVL